MMPDDAPAKVLSPREIADKWTAAAQQLPFDAAKSISAAATTWTTFLTGAIGAFSIGGLAFLPSELGKLEGAQRDWVVLLLFAAVITGLVARYLATLATQVTPMVAYTDGDLYRNQTQRQNFEAADRLTQSQGASMAALAFLLLGVLFSLIPPEKPYRLVHQQAGPTLCGKLVSNRNGELYVNRVSEATKLSGVTELTAVASCPKP